MKMKIFTEGKLDIIPQLARLTPEERLTMKVVASVLPFRVNNHVIDNLIDWDNIPNDPLYQLTFPQRGMLAEDDFVQIADLFKSELYDKKHLFKLAHQIRSQLNPHPADQMTRNVPEIDGKLTRGIQHKYKETVLFFPNQGQTCHSYCTFCFRWAQFIGDKNLTFAAKENTELLEYLKRNQQISNLLVTGGDPMIMKTQKLTELLLPLLHSDYDHIQAIRIGTKALTYWPYRFTQDDDADDLLRLIERLSQQGKHVAIMLHLNHWREIEHPEAEKAVANLRNAGATLRSQGPILAHVNDDASVWKTMWEKQVKLGIIPYYMFVERDTGAKHYFELPLVRAYHVYRDAIRQVSGLARTARGPSMSTSPGKVEVQGIVDIGGKKAFVLRFIQARNPEWIQEPFFAEYNEKATWLSQLKPLSGERFFFDENSLKIVDDKCLVFPEELHVA